MPSRCGPRRAWRRPSGSLAGSWAPWHGSLGPGACSTDGGQHASDDPLDRRNGRVLELVGRREGDMRRRDPHDRSIEVVEELLPDDRRDLGSPATEARVLLDREQTRRLRDRRPDRRHVERNERTNVDHLGVEAIRAELLGRLQRARHHRGERHERDVPAGTTYQRATELLHVFTLRHLSLGCVEGLVLEDDDRIRIADRAGQQPLRIRRGRRRNDLEAGNGHRPVLEALGMLRAEARARTVRRADHERERDLSVRHVSRLGDLVRDQIPARGQEVGEHDLGDRTEPRHRGAHRRPGDRLLRDRRVADTLGSEPLEQPDRRLERATSVGHILAEEEDERVAFHLLRDALRDGLPIGQFRHADPPSLQTSRSMIDNDGLGDAVAISVASSTSRSASASIAVSISARPPAASRAGRYSRTGSRANHSCTSDSGRYLAGSAREWPPCRYVTASTSEGPSPSRARPMVERATSSIASASFPSTRMDSKPYAEARSAAGCFTAVTASIGVYSIKRLFSHTT